MRSLDGLRKQVEKLAGESKPQPCYCLLPYSSGEDPPIDEPGMLCPNCGCVRAGHHTIVEEVVVHSREEALGVMKRIGM